MTNTKRLILWSIIGTGISSIVVQLITIREFLTQFHGNEITISLVLFCWLLLTGLGSLAAKAIRRSSLTAYALLILTIALWPLVQMILIRGFREVVFIHGTSPGFYQIFFYILVTITPYCLLVGFILPYALEVLNQSQQRFTSGQLYLTDSIGDITGGVLFTFIFVTWMKPFKTIALTSSLLVIIGLLLLAGSRRYLLCFAAVLSTALFYIFAMNSHFETLTLSGQYGDMLRYSETPYGRLVITREGQQHTFWESGLPLYSDANVMNSEEKIHYPLSQMDKIENVLLISGGLGETLVEVTKYQPKCIDYVELDPHLTGAAEELGFIAKSPLLTVLNTDGRQYIKTTQKKYDAIIIDLPDPDTFQINRFFTSEFFSLTKKVLSKGGVLSFGLAYSPNYLSDTTKKKLSSIYHTARLHFESVRVLPGGEAYFLCRDGKLWEDIPRRLSQKSITTSYVEGFYYGNVTEERIKELEKSLQSQGYINTDFQPRIMNLVLQEWFAVHGTSPTLLFLVLLAMTILYLLLMKKAEYLLFSTGLATMGLEMLIIFTFQVMYGYIYLEISAIITAFLVGLLPGAIVGYLSSDERHMASLILSEVVLLCLLLMFFVWISFFGADLHPAYFLAYCFVFSFFCGYQFPAATRLIGEEKSPAAGCLAADLTGAGVGTLATGTLLIPLWGIQSAIIFLILVKISSNIVILFTKVKGIAK
jgi:spermidine synthase